MTISSRDHKIVLAGIAIFCLVFFALACWKYINFYYSGIDLAIFNQVFFQTIHGNWFGTSIHPPTYLRDHFSPIILLLAPLYALAPHPMTLVGTQIFFIALSAYPCYLLGKHIVNTRWGLGAAALWLLNPFVHTAALFEFHFYSVGVFFLLWAFYFFIKKRLWLFLSFATAAMLCREDIALAVAAFGIVALLERRPWYWVIGPVVAGGAYFIIALKVIAAFAPGNSYKFLVYYSWLGTGFLDMAKNALLKPWLVATRIINLGSLLVIAGLTLPFFFLPLRKPKYLLVAAPLFVQLMLGVHWQQAGTFLWLYYSLPLVAVCLVAGLTAVATLRNTLIGGVTLTGSRVAFLVGVSTVYGMIFLGPVTGLTATILHKGIIAPTTTSRWEMLSHIPNGSAIAATYRFQPHLSSRDQLSSLHYAYLGQQQFGTEAYALPVATEYLLVDLEEIATYYGQYHNHVWYASGFEAGARAWQKTISTFSPLIEVDNMVLLKKSDAPRSLADVRSVTDGEATVSLVSTTTTPEGWTTHWKAPDALPLDAYARLRLWQDEKIIAEYLSPLAWGEYKNDTLELRHTYSLVSPQCCVATIQIVTVESAYLDRVGNGLILPKFSVTEKSDPITLPARY